MIIMATLKCRFVCRCVFRHGVESGPRVTWHGTACAASLDGSCQARDALEFLPELHRDAKRICLNSLKIKLVLQVLVLRNAFVCCFGGVVFRSMTRGLYRGFSKIDKCDIPIFVCILV